MSYVYYYILSFDAAFKYIDYLELKEARKTAKQANDNSIRAHTVAMWALGAATVVPFIILWIDKCLLSS